MHSAGLIVVGSGPAGIAAAEAYRERDADASVLVVTDDPQPPYQRPPLSKDYLRGDGVDVAMHPPQWYLDRRIELLHTGRVDALDPAARVITAGGIRYPYRSMVLACGSRPTPLPVPGGDTVLQLRSLSDADRLRHAAQQADSAVVIGAGFIGCEAAASLAARGVSVTLIAPDPVPQAKRLGTEAGERILGILADAGVRYVSGPAVEAVTDGVVHLDDGTRIASDLVLAATGVRPQTELARSAGLAVSAGRIVVRSDMRTSTQNVYAAGDAAIAFNPSAGRPLAVEHWGDAIDQGHVAGACAAGGNAKWDRVPGFWTTIGTATLKYHAWGDGYEHSHLSERSDGFTVWYETGGSTVGVLTCNADDDYDLAERLVLAGSPPPERSASSTARWPIPS